MLLCLDVGNSHIFGGVFVGEKLKLSFRYPSKDVSTSDQIGVFLRGVLRENNIKQKDIKDIALCSVVPFLNYSLRAACLKYFNKDPFVLKAGVKTGLQIKIKNPLELGADRIANAIAAMTRFPSRNIIVIDLGTATTFCVLTANKEYLGGVIMAGMNLSMEALANSAALLSPVNIVKPECALGRTTVANIQSGLYFGHLGMIKELTSRIIQEAFGGEMPLVLGTGGFANLFSQQNLFAEILPDLVLDGLRVAWRLNQSFAR